MHENYHGTTDEKNIFTYCFRPMQRLQPYFKTDSMRNFMYTKHNRGNTKLRIFSFIPQRQRIQPNFMNHKYQTTKQTNTTRTTKTTTPTRVSCSNFGINLPISYNFVHFIDPQKLVLGLMSDFVHFIHPYTNPLPKFRYVCHKLNKHY